MIPPPTSGNPTEHQRAALEGRAGWLHRAIVQAPMPDIPAGFATRVATLAGDFAEKAELETRIQRVLLAATGLLALVLAAPGLLHGLRAIAALTLHPAAQTPPLFATALALAVAALIDAAFRRHQRGSARPG